jgi:hypothetical protein
VRQHTPAARLVRTGNPCISPSLGLYPPHPEKKNYNALFFFISVQSGSLLLKKTNVADRHWFNADPDPGSRTNAGPCGYGSLSNFAVTRSLILA